MRKWCPKYPFTLQYWAVFVHPVQYIHNFHPNCTKQGDSISKIVALSIKIDSKYLLTHRRNVGLDRAIEQARVDLFHHFLHRMGNFLLKRMKWSIAYTPREITAGKLTFPGKLDQFKYADATCFIALERRRGAASGRLRY
jgi:hypothetical protein